MSLFFSDEDGTVFEETRALYSFEDVDTLEEDDVVSSGEAGFLRGWLQE